MLLFAQQNLVAAVANGIFALAAGYYELPPEEPLESYGYQVIEDAPSITGSGAVTESADIAAGSGSQSTTGTGSAAESADTASGAGSQSLVGTGAATEGVDTASGTGTASASGSGATTEGADTASGAGSGGGAGATDALILLSGYYEAAPERIEVYESFLTFVDQVSGVTGSGSVTEGGDTASGTGSSQGDAILVLDFPDEDWIDEIPDATFSLIFEQPIFDGSGNPTEGGDTASGVGSMPSSGTGSATESGDVANGSGDTPRQGYGYYCGELRDFARKTLTKRQIAEQRKALGILADYPQQAAAEIVKGLMDPDVSSNDLDMMQAEIASQADRLARLMGIVIEHQQFLAALDLQIRVRRDEEAAVMAVIAAYQYQ